MTFLDQLRLLHFGARDLVEILIVAFVLYRVLLLIQGTRAVQMLVGIVILELAYAVAWFAKLTMLTVLLDLIFRYGAFAALIIFQPELRASLAHLGQARVGRFFQRLEETDVADEIADAVERLARNGTGALIAIERDVPLGEFVESGSPMQAKVSADLLTTIFTPYSPLHDGAVIIRGDSIIGAGAILPLSQEPPRDRTLGTRHRAAIGLSEETDALVIVVSEETAQISVARYGRLQRGLTIPQLRDIISGREPRTATGEHPVLQLRA
jgi:diadenylate cyclase